MEGGDPVCSTLARPRQEFCVQVCIKGPEQPDQCLPEMTQMAARPKSRHQVTKLKEDVQRYGGVTAKLDSLLPWLTGLESQTNGSELNKRRIS